MANVSIETNNQSGGSNDVNQSGAKGIKLSQMVKGGGVGIGVLLSALSCVVLK